MFQHPHHVSFCPSSIVSATRRLEESVVQRTTPGTTAIDKQAECSSTCRGVRPRLGLTAPNVICQSASLVADQSWLPPTRGRGRARRSLALAVSLPSRQTASAPGFRDEESGGRRRPARLGRYDIPTVDDATVLTFGSWRLLAELGFILCRELRLKFRVALEAL